MKDRNLQKRIEIDAKGRKLGRIASEIAHILTGKNRPDYLPYVDAKNKVVVFNSDKLVLTGKKSETKKYISHSKYPGGIKERSHKDIFKNDPSKILKVAVYGMLPSNKLRKKMMKRLLIHKGGISERE